jgi:hypothetical protein
MPIPGTVPFTGLIAPTDTTDTYPVTDSIYGIDGLRSVADSAARDAISAGRRREGMLVYTQSDGKYWKLDSNLTSWTEFTSGSTSPGGSPGEVQYNNSGSFDGAAGVNYGSGDLLTVAAQAASDIPLVVEGAASQTGNLQEWRDSSSNVLAAVHSNGVFKVNAHYGNITTNTDGATVTFNLSVTDKHIVTLGGNRTLAVSNVQDGQAFIIILKQDATGGRTVTWWNNILWPAGFQPVLTVTGDKHDVFSFLRVSSSLYLGFIIGQEL